MNVRPSEAGVAIMNATDLYERAERFYQERLRADLERTHLHSFVAIEPESGDFFLGRTLSEASAAASAVYPERRCCILRVGHPVALQLGAGYNRSDRPLACLPGTAACAATQLTAGPSSSP